jgi:molybdopterin synthase sulfur carrier subunit
MMITIHVLFFAHLREQLNCSELNITLNKHSNVFDLYQTMQTNNPKWYPIFSESSIHVAVNQTIAEPTTCLNDGDEVAFFPPVTGG